MLDTFERYPLIFGPTPIERLERLSAHLGGNVQIYAKREDCNSGLAFGGNKLRKLEYIVPDAIASGADTLVTIGGIQSNHTRQVVAVAASSLWRKSRERREWRGARLTRRVREEYRVYFDRNATQSASQKRGSGGMHRRSNAA